MSLALPLAANTTWSESPSQGFPLHSVGDPPLYSTLAAKCSSEQEPRVTIFSKDDFREASGQKSLLDVPISEEAATSLPSILSSSSCGRSGPLLDRSHTSPHLTHPPKESFLTSLACSQELQVCSGTRTRTGLLSADIFITLLLALVQDKRRTRRPWKA